jgi:large repetitive protein
MSQHESTLTFITESLPAFTVGQPYDFDLEASGGSPPYVFAVTQGELPPGVALSSAGKISGTATVAGDTTVFVKLSDAAGSHLTQAFDCQIS